MDLDDGERAFLTAHRAVTVEEDGIERYVGLTQDESADYLTLSRANNLGGLSGSDRARFDVLHGRHEAARQVYAHGEKSLHPFQKP